MKKMLALAFILLMPVLCQAADISLAWDASPTPTVTRYKVYWGPSSRTYTQLVVIGNQTAYTVTGLTTGTWYFAVTAADDIGNESDYSNEVHANIGGTVAPPPNFHLVPKDISNTRPNSQGDN